MCTDYFFYTNKKDEIKVVVEKMKNMLEAGNAKIKMNFSIVCMLCEAKSNILNNENLSQVKNFYEHLAMPATTPSTKWHHLLCCKVQYHRYNKRDKLQPLHQKQPSDANG